ncbi:alpha/beta hydrolase [Pollutibacter soli]|uniref:alpha/beta fold hydrolase n=1 Tax=Pollutibacter soli TaxID=3034157 RepID=UPI003013DCB4
MEKNNESVNVKDTAEVKTGYSDIDGIRMYYEIYGHGKPLVLIHGGGSTIQSTFGRIIPLFEGRQIIGVELQAHGRTSDRGKPSSFEQDADDVAALLKNLNISKADIFGFSNGGNTTMQMAVRHPGLVNRIIIASSFYKREGMIAGFWEGMNKSTFDDMPADLKTAFLKVNPDTNALHTMYERDATRMQNFKDWDDGVLKSIKAKSLIICGDKDVNTVEHAVAMYRLIPQCELAVIPAGHGTYLGEVMEKNPASYQENFVVKLVQDFLDK